MKNIYLHSVMDLTVDNYTSVIGLKLRKWLNPLVRRVTKRATKKKIVVDCQPGLEKGKPYIFASTHHFTDDIASALAALDRNAYALIGTSDQIEHNPKMYLAWVNGMIYVNRLDRESRKEALEKMKRSLNAGTSVLIFAEVELRDSMATMMYEHIVCHAKALTREELQGRKDAGMDYRLVYMEDRRREYLSLKWTRDVWDVELFTYSDIENPSPAEVRKSYDCIEVTKNNAYVLAPILAKRWEDEKYDFKKYMKENWDK